LQKISHSGCKVFSVIDIKSAFHSIPLAKHAQIYVGISSYPGGESYYYNKLPMGLSVSPALWQSKINESIGEIPGSRDWCLAIHDDIIIFSENKIQIQICLLHLIKHITLARIYNKLCRTRVQT
jgi:hypothetical protein